MRTTGPRATSPRS